MHRSRSISTLTAQLEAEKALQLAQTPARKTPVKAKKDEGFWDWLVDLFSF